MFAWLWINSTRLSKRSPDSLTLRVWIDYHHSSKKERKKVLQVHFLVNNPFKLLFVPLSIITISGVTCVPYYYSHSSAAVTPEIVRFIHQEGNTLASAARPPLVARMRQCGTCSSDPVQSLLICVEKRERNKHIKSWSTGHVRSYISERNNSISAFKSLVPFLMQTQKKATKLKDSHGTSVTYPSDLYEVTYRISCQETRRRKRLRTKAWAAHSSRADRLQLHSLPVKN